MEIIISLLILIASIMILGAVGISFYFAYYFMSFYGMFDKKQIPLNNEKEIDRFEPSTTEDITTLDRFKPDFSKKIKLKFK